MNEKYIYLIEKFFEGILTFDEEKEFNSLLQNDNEFKKEFEKQKEIKEVLSKMKMKNPSPEVWDNYWQNIYNRFERKSGWIIFLSGILLLFGYASYLFVDQFLLVEDKDTPLIIKFGVTGLLLGAVILLSSVIREKIYTYKRDKYKEIQR